ncbi:MAG: Dna2/Cas4 domain-containing protein [Caldiserica bacterium]|nr:Dna2/Cas4 domain-containing protein [Caldisericota bacterium]
MLVERLEDFFSRVEEPRERDYFYVSEVAKCPRQIYYAVKGFPRPPLDGQSARRLAVGDDVHRRIVGALFSMGVAVAAEVPIPPNPLFHGRADAIVSLGGETFVVEIKSVHPYQFDQTTAGPKRDHYLQLQLYLHYLDVPRGIILMENKANQALREFVVDRNEETIRRVIADFTDLHRLIFREGKLPPLPDKSGWEYDQCRYCPFVEFCVRDQSRAELLEREIAGAQSSPGPDLSPSLGSPLGDDAREPSESAPKSASEAPPLFDL